MIRALALALCLPVAFQDADPRHASLRVRAQSNGKVLKLSGTVDMPDGAVLRIVTQEEVMRMDHGKDECRLVLDQVVYDEVRTFEVERRKFVKDVEFARQGLYGYSIGYSRHIQVSMAVQAALGDAYPHWSQAFRAVLFEPKPLLRALADERAVLLGFLETLGVIAAKITLELKKEEDKRDWAPIQKEIFAVEKRILEFQPRTAYAATCGIAFDTLDKMRGCALKKLGFKPGSPEAQHAQEGKKDIADGVNDEWQLELVLAYIARGRRALDRERQLLPLRYAKARWDEYLAAVRADGSSEAEMNAAETEWGRAAECVRDNVETVARELPEKRKRSSDEALIAEWCEITPGVIDRLGAFARERRAARGRSAEELEKIDGEGEKDALKGWEGLTQSLKIVPSRP